jgi:ankyrin repeat protein
LPDVPASVSRARRPRSQRLLGRRLSIANCSQFPGFIHGAIVTRCGFGTQQPDEDGDTVLHSACAEGYYMVAVTNFPLGPVTFLLTVDICCGSINPLINCRNGLLKAEGPLYSIYRALSIYNVIYR